MSQIEKIHFLNFSTHFVRFLRVLNRENSNVQWIIIHEFFMYTQVYIYL